LNFASFNGHKIFSKEWYNEYFQRATFSETHSRFCEQVYGKDLCQHGMMDMMELDFLVSLLKPNSNILEVGCSNGYITEYIHDKSSCSLIGIDFSDVAITQAQSRTESNSKTLRFECVDLISESIPGGDYDFIILVDSIYFMVRPIISSYQYVLQNFNEKLSDSGKLIISNWQDRQENTPDSFLTGNHLFEQALRQSHYNYTAYDFTENVRSHWMKNHQTASELRPAFLAEDNEFLYEARLAENIKVFEKAENNEFVSFMYAIDKNS
jgi:SAM-dependent methyltransferase